MIDIICLQFYYKEKTKCKHYINFIESDTLIPVSNIYKFVLLHVNVSLERHLNNWKVVGRGENANMELVKGIPFCILNSWFLLLDLMVLRFNLLSNLSIQNRLIKWGIIFLLYIFYLSFISSLVDVRFDFFSSILYIIRAQINVYVCITE